MVYVKSFLKKLKKFLTNIKLCCKIAFVEDLSAVLEKIKKYSVRGVVDKVTTKEIVSYKPGDLDTDSNISITKKVAILDVGTKFNIARCLLKRGCEVTIYSGKNESRNDSCVLP